MIKHPEESDVDCIIRLNNETKSAKARLSELKETFSEMRLNYMKDLNNYR